jgi:hypothetical protein
LWSIVLPALLASCSGSSGPGPSDAGEVDHSIVIPTQDVLSPDAADAADAGLDLPPDPGTDAGKDVPVVDPGGFEYECNPLAVESCVTACGSAGTRKCLKAWGPCLPPQEFCGNCTDDDCDGLINEDCAPNPACEPPKKECPVALISIAEGVDVWTKDTLHLSASGSFSKNGKIAKWDWSVEVPAGAAGTFQPSAFVEAPTFAVDAAGQYLFRLDVRDETDTKSCVPALATVNVKTYPPLQPEVGCADGGREGFLDTQAYPQIAACAGAWEKPGVSPDSVVPTCGRKGGNSGPNPSGAGCASADLCAEGWHVCKAWQEVAQKSSTGCAGATPPDAKSKSLFFAIRQPSKSFSKCGKDGDGDNDVFGCGNLGTGLGPDKDCGPLDRVLASMQADSCGFNEAEPPLGPWECKGGPGSDLTEGAHVTKKACANASCSYDGQPVGSSDKGGVLCCRDGSGS